jgi:hypothetical protein
MKLKLYLEQKKKWPIKGRHILAQYDETSIIVYQAYRPAIGNFASKNGYFGGEFRLSRMSWIKPNFLWMMYRSAWGTKLGQEVILAVRLKREFFDSVLAQAVFSTYNPKIYVTEEEWKKAVAKSFVRLQWDPDHDPSGKKVQRRAIQLGLREKVLAEYARDAILEILDISDFVKNQKANVQGDYSSLEIPKEEVYYPDEEISNRIGL